MRNQSLSSWYRQYRQRGERAIDAISSARANSQAYTEATNTLESLSSASRARVEAFVHDFIRGAEVEYLTSDRDQDFTNEPERASRVSDAAELGADGKTHSEVIEDWRDAFSNWLRDNHKEYWRTSERFATAVLASFTLTELWHEFNGSLFQEIG